MPAEDLQVFPYREDRLVLVTPREHVLAGRAEIALREAAGFDFIGLQQDASLHTLLQQSAQQMGTPLRLRIQVRSFEAICRMIHTGMGIGVLPEQVVRNYLRSEEHTSELQSLMRISYAVFCLKKKK